MGKCVSRKNILDKHNIYVKEDTLYIEKFNFKENNLILDMIKYNESIKKVIINDNEINIEFLFKK